MSKDWFDRSGKAARWVGRNVLNVTDFQWDREGFSIVLPDGSEEPDALSGDVDIQRVKFHYFEQYRYEMLALSACGYATRFCAKFFFFYGC